MPDEKLSLIRNWCCLTNQVREELERSGFAASCRRLNRPPYIFDTAYNNNPIDSKCLFNDISSIKFSLSIVLDPSRCSPRRQTDLLSSRGVLCIWSITQYPTVIPAPSFLGLHKLARMSSSTLLRTAARSAATCLFRSSQPAVRRLSPPRIYKNASAAHKCARMFSAGTLRKADKDTGVGSGHHDETFEEFSARYVSFPYPD